MSTDVVLQFPHIIRKIDVGQFIITSMKNYNPAKLIGSRFQ